MLTLEQIKEQTFSKSAFGYKAEEVDRFIDEVEDTMYQLLAQQNELEQKLVVLSDVVLSYQQKEEEIEQNLETSNAKIETAKKEADQIVFEANVKAKLICEEAGEKAKAALDEALTSAQQIINEQQEKINKEQQALINLQKEVSEFKQKLLALYKSHLEQIVAMPEIDITLPIREESETDTDVYEDVNPPQDADPGYFIEQSEIAKMIDEKDRMVQDMNINMNAPDLKTVFDRSKFKDLQFGEDVDINE